MTPDDAEFVRGVHADGRVAYRSGLATHVASATDIAAVGRQAPMINAVVTSLRDGRPLGHVFASRHLDRNDAVTFGAFMVPGQLNLGTGIEASMTFLDYLFATYGFRKVYTWATDLTYRKYAFVTGLFAVEACLTGHDYYDGSYVDRRLLSMSRESWLALRDVPMPSSWRDLVEGLRGVLGHGEAVR
jgi:RimJ/RimL family protein N-acetyltransferase